MNAEVKKVGMSLENSTKSKKKGSKLKTVENVAMISAKQLALMALIFVVLSIGFFLLLRNKGTVSDFFGLDLTTETETLYSAMYYDDGSNSGTYIPQNVRSLDNTKIYTPVVIDSSTYKDVELSDLAEFILAEALSASEDSEKATSMVNTVSANVDKYSNPSFMKEINDKVDSVSEIALTDAQVQRAEYLNTLVPVISAAVERVQTSLPSVMDQTLKVTDMALTLRSLFRVVAGENPSESQMVMSELKTSDISNELKNTVMPALDDIYESEQSDVELIERLYAEIMKSYDDISTAVQEQLARELQELTDRADELVSLIARLSNEIGDYRLDVEDAASNVSLDLSYEDALIIKDTIDYGIADSNKNLDLIKSYIKELEDISKRKPDSEYLASLAKSSKSAVDNPNKWIREMNEFSAASASVLRQLIAANYLDDILTDITKTEGTLIDTLDRAEIAYQEMMADPNSSTALSNAMILEQARDIASKASDNLDVNESKLNNFLSEYSDFEELFGTVDRALESINVARNIIDDINSFVDNAEKTDRIMEVVALAKDIINTSEQEVLQSKDLSSRSDMILSEIQSYLNSITDNVSDVRSSLKAEKSAVDGIESNYYMGQAKSALDKADKNYENMASYDEEIKSLLEEAERKLQVLTDLSKQYPDSERIAELRDEAKKDVDHIKEVYSMIKDIKRTSESQISKAKKEYKNANSSDSFKANNLSFALAPYAINIQKFDDYRFDPGSRVTFYNSSYGFGVDMGYYRRFGSNKFSFDLGVSVSVEYYLYFNKDNWFADEALGSTRLVLNAYAVTGMTASISDTVDFRFDIGLGFNYLRSISGGKNPEMDYSVPRPAITTRIGVAIKLLDNLYLDVYGRGSVAVDWEKLTKGESWFETTYKQLGLYVGVTYKF